MFGDLLLRRKRRPATRFAIPEGRRVYAVGDIHGRRDLLDRLLARIEADDAARGEARTTLLFLGDYVDRGPDSRGVIERLIALRDSGRDSGPDAVFLMGNHEEVLLDIIEGDRGTASAFGRMGGRETLASYGMDDADYEASSSSRICRRAAELIPETHVAFLRALGDHARIGDYLFVHAGIRPGIAIDRQKRTDLRWIRGDFLNHEGDHGMVVVHGHSISEAVHDLPNRIGIDTGAYATGRLTAVGLEGEDRWYLES